MHHWVKSLKDAGCYGKDKYIVKIVKLIMLDGG